MKIVIGMTGSGKSMSQVPSIVQATVLERRPAYISDPDGTMGWEVAKHVIASGEGHRLIYDELSDTKRSLKWKWFP